MTTSLNLASIKPSLDKLQILERELAASLIERDEVIRASLVALLARQRLAVLGPPGTAKSALVTEPARRVSPQNGAGLRSFAYLMTRFTTPEELFGPVSVSGLKRDEYRRITAGKLVEATSPTPASPNSSVGLLRSSARNKTATTQMAASR